MIILLVHMLELRGIYEWDPVHNDIEVYDYKGNHIGSKNPATGELYKGPVKSRNIKGKIYCPWCGLKLPKELGDELCEIIFDQLNLDDFQDPRLPEEFKTEE